MAWRLAWNGVPDVRSRQITMQIVVIHTAALSAIEVITEPSALSVEQAVHPRKD